ncbi:MAG: SPFH domain-containing protein [Candidatus Hodarchaeota archaeon]
MMLQYYDFPEIDPIGLMLGISIPVAGVVVLIIVIAYFKSLVVVPFNEVHVVSRGKGKVTQYDGSGRYVFLKFLYSRTIIPKHVLDIEPPLIKLHDVDKLPFGVEISVKVQVTDPPKAAQTLTRIDHNTISKVVEDTVMSAARSIAMERNILEIMKEREEIENAIYVMVSDALNKLGLSPIIFDIKNIRDIEDSDVIASLEKVKIAELRKDARISESTHNSQAVMVEVEKEKESRVKGENMKREEEQARLAREKMVAEESLAVEERKLMVQTQNTQKLAEMERNKKMILAKADADAVKIKAEAEADAVKLKHQAEAEGIRLRGIAEAEAIAKKAEAMREFNDVSAEIKMLEILAKAQVDMGAEVAKALGSNNKIMYLPANGEGGGLLAGFMPKLDALLQSGVLKKGLAELMGSIKEGKEKKEGKRVYNITEKTKTF